MEKEKAGAGMVVSNSELEEGKEKAPSTDMVYTEERIENSYDSREVYIAKEIDSEISKLDWEKNLNNEKK